MMKKYNKPEIVTLALDMVDVIETSGATDVTAAAVTEGLISENKVTIIEKQVTAMNDTWSW